LWGLLELISADPTKIGAKINSELNRCSKILELKGHLIATKVNAVEQKTKVKDFNQISSCVSHVPAHKSNFKCTHVSEKRNWTTKWIICKFK
jgi:hypothetical protein